jgi:8-oxo-dGTP pyrophosphatase MutT (NUDIX family)
VAQAAHDCERILPVGRDDAEIVRAGGGVVLTSSPFEGMMLIAEAQPVRWRLPKGMVDPGETVAEAALREVLEETGVSARIVESLGTVQWPYSYEGKAYLKVVEFFLMVPSRSVAVRLDDDHARGVALVTLPLACEILHFEAEQGIAHGAVAKLAAGPFE